MLSLAMSLLVLAGCSDNPDEDADTPTGSLTEEPTVVPTFTPPDEEGFSFSAYFDDNGMWRGVTALDYVTMFNYRAVQVPSDVHRISEDVLQFELKRFLIEFPEKDYIIDRAVEDGDTINIDYAGSVDGVAFEGGTADDQTVTIGVTSFIDDFLEQLIGRMPGETVTVNVTFPDEYWEESLQGKPAVFMTTINYISDVVLTDELVATHFFDDFGWTTVAELMEDMRSELSEAAIHEYIEEYFIREVEIDDIPELMIEFQVSSMMEHYLEQATSSGMELEEFLFNTSPYSNIEELFNATYERNLLNSALYLVLQAVAEDAGFSVNNDDVASYFEEYFGTRDYTPAEEHYGLPYLKHRVLTHKTMVFIRDNAVLL